MTDIAESILLHTIRIQNVGLCLINKFDIYFYLGLIVVSSVYGRCDCSLMFRKKINKCVNICILIQCKHSDWNNCILVRTRKHIQQNAKSVNMLYFKIPVLSDSYRTVIENQILAIPSLFYYHSVMFWLNGRLTLTGQTVSLNSDYSMVFSVIYFAALSVYLFRFV